MTNCEVKLESKTHGQILLLLNINENCKLPKPLVKQQQQKTRNVVPTPTIIVMEIAKRASVRLTKAANKLYST